MKNLTLTAIICIGISISTVIFLPFNSNGQSYTPSLEKLNKELIELDINKDIITVALSVLTNDDTNIDYYYLIVSQPEYDHYVIGNEIIRVVLSKDKIHALWIGDNLFNLASEFEKENI